MKTRAKWIVGSVALTTAIVAAASVLRTAQPEPLETALMYDTLPFYVKDDLRPRWRNADRRHISGLHLRDQHDVAIDEHVFAHGPTVVNFFFSGCTSVCPISMEMLNLTRKDLGAEAPSFLSISVTPMADKPAILAQYATRIGLPADWHLATGLPNQVFAAAKSELLTDIETPGPDGQPPHTERAMLVDNAGRIRGIYDANQASELMRLRYDLKRLRSESAVGVPATGSTY